MIQRQSGSVSFTQCHCCKETRWLESGVCHSVGEGVLLSRHDTFYKCFYLLGSKDFDMFIWICSVSSNASFLSFVLHLLPMRPTMCRSTCVFWTMRWPTPTSASATLWQYTTVAGISDLFLLTFSSFCLKIFSVISDFLF